MTHAPPDPGSEDATPRKRTKPPWLKVKLPTGEAYRKVRGLVSEHKLTPSARAETVPTWGSAGEKERRHS